MHTGDMRTTVNLDDEVYELANAYAKGKGISLGAALCELIHRQRQTATDVERSPRLVRNEHGYLEIAKSRRAVTPAMVKEASEDEVA